MCSQFSRYQAAQFQSRKHARRCRTQGSVACRICAVLGAALSRAAEATEASDVLEARADEALRLSEELLARFEDALPGAE